MSENPTIPVASSPGRRAPLVVVLSIFALFALFLIVLYFVYVPRQTGVFADDGIHTPEQRKKTLAEMRTKEVRQASNYGWVDQKSGVVQLPLDRAMELTLQRYAKKP
jgi:hypothetical protein